MDKLRVLIADDDVISRKTISEAVERTGLGSVIHTASNGIIALEWLKQCELDVVLLDVYMPEMDGFETLKFIKKENPKIEIIMISTGGTDSAQITFEALKQGALDFITKLSGNALVNNIEMIKSQLQVLFAQIKVRKNLIEKKNNIVENLIEEINPAKQNYSNEINYESEQKIWKGADIVVIASSTGGPAALEKIFPKLKPEFNRPVLVVQHMPPDFTRVLAHVLDGKCHLKVLEGFDGCNVKEGQVVIAPGGFHMGIEAGSNLEYVIRIIDTPYVNGVKPAADVLFQSLAKAYSGKSILIVVLTGMGSDGKKGIEELRKKCNCYCITQNESSCVVYGMPRCVAEAGLSDEVVDLDDISTRICQIAAGRS